MRRYWKIIAAVVILLLLAGIVLGGTGILTGASPDRIAELLFGGWDGLYGTVQSWLDSAADTAAAVTGTDAVGFTVVVG